MNDVCVVEKVNSMFNKVIANSSKSVEILHLLNNNTQEKY